MVHRTGIVSLIACLTTATLFAAPPAHVAAPAGRAEALLPLERQVRDQFPSVVLDSQATLEPAQELVAGQVVSGMRARPLPSGSSAHPPLQPLVQPLVQPLLIALQRDGDASSAGPLRVFYPAAYNGTFVVELGEQRVALRAVGAHFAQATASGGKLFYASPHNSVDVIEVPSAGRSEELLLLHDTRAPRIFEYEIVEMRGVAGVSLQDGAIRFAPDHVVMPAVSEMLSGRFTDPQPSLQIDRPWVIDANGQRSESAAQWTILNQKDQPRRIRLTIHSDPLAYPIVVDPSFSATGNMASARRDHTATLLQNGKVLIAGGSNGSALNTAELYDPASGTFTATNAPMTAARYSHTATLLANGKVLIAGGFNGSAGVNTAELYDPASGTFAATIGPMTASRIFHTATLLSSGKVLIAGGTTGSARLNTAELYDPSGGTFSATIAPMASARYNHTATLLPNGNVLIAGGQDSSALNGAELYDPGNGRFTATSSPMTSSRYFHTATLLPNGNVLIAGGSNGSATLITAEIYDPVGATFAATTWTMTSARYVQTATLLPNGKLLIAGGYNGSAYVNTAELYDPAGGTFTATSPMTAARLSHTATLLPNGRVLIAGGYNVSAYLNTAELYDSASGTFTATSGMTTFRHDHTATLLPSGKVLIAGGNNGTGLLSMGSPYLNSAELFDPDNGTFTATSTPMISSRSTHTATLLQSGKVLIAGGTNVNGSALNTAELYDPVGGTFTATLAPMTAPRRSHTATLLPDGKVLVAGGSNDDGSTAVSTAELYDPASRTFTATITPMTAVRYSHTATLLPNGKVLIAGGTYGLGASLDTAELYDPSSGTFTATVAPMTLARFGHTATLLPNGKVLIAGGSGNTAELYDPAGGTFTATSAPMIASRVNHSATLLANGKVLIAGGPALNTAELFDPPGGTFTATTTPMTAARRFHTATLVPNGKVLIAGGSDGSAFFESTTNAAELYDAGLGFPDARRPVVSSLTPHTVCQPATLTLSGSLFTGDSEGSYGGANSSAANAPLLRLQRIDNEQFRFILSQSFSASSFVSASLSNLSSGRYRAAIVSNAIPSIEQIIDVETTPLLATYGTASVNLSGSTGVAPSSLPAGYNGAFYPQTASGSAGFTGTLTVNGTTGVVTVMNAGPVGDYTITISTSTSCGLGSSTRTFTLKVLGSPTSVTATGGAPQSAQANASFAAPLEATVKDSAGHPLDNVAVSFTAPSSGASATLPGGGSALTNASGIATITPTADGILGVYTVTAAVGGLTASFALTNTAATPIGVVATAITPTSVSITWNGTGGATYEVLRVAAGGVSSTIGSSGSGSLTDSTATADTAYLYKVRAIAPSTSPYGEPDLATTVIFTDPSLGVGTTVIKVAHFAELRIAVDAVRTLAGLGGGSYIDPTLFPGVTLVKAAHLTDLRSALDAARSTLLLPAVSYTTPNIVGGTTTISAADIADLRNGVR